MLKEIYLVHFDGRMADLLARRGLAKYYALTKER